MMEETSKPQSPAAEMSRRNFLKMSAAGAATAALYASGNYAYAQGSDTLKVGVIGTGGRGRGATINCIESSAGVQIWALGDFFKDRAANFKADLAGAKAANCKVTDERVFGGIDAYKGVLASGVDMVILATHPGFRPPHFKAAIEAGKHVFMEKPVGTDAPGIRTMLAAAAMADQKKLCVVAGTQRRHEANYVETVKRIHDGAIGDLVGGQVYWNGGGVGNGVNPRGATETDLEWMIHNWYQFTWLCGDNIVEQHVHNIDVANWVFQAHPVKCIAMGGRSQRMDPVRFPMAFDHFAVDFEYPNGVRVMSMCRHWDGCPGNVSERVVGTKGVANPGWEIWGQNAYKFAGKREDPYKQEHTDLIAAIRSGKQINEAKQVAESTLTAIMGRLACYTGQEVTWDQALNSQENLMPNLSDPKAAIEVKKPAVPGQTQLI